MCFQPIRPEAGAQPGHHLGERLMCQQLLMLGSPLGVQGKRKEMETSGALGFTGHWNQMMGQLWGPPPQSAAQGRANNLLLSLEPSASLPISRANLSWPLWPPSNTGLRLTRTLDPGTKGTGLLRVTLQPLTGLQRASVWCLQTRGSSMRSSRAECWAAASRARKPRWS